MHIVLLNYSLKLFVFSTHLLKVFRVQSLLCEVDKDAPSPVLLLKRVLHRLDLDTNKTSRH